MVYSHKVLLKYFIKTHERSELGFFSPFFYISLENPVLLLRQGVTIQKNCLNKKGFQGMLSIFDILS